jgi:ABC-2 type transport system permease protein
MTANAWIVAGTSLRRVLKQRETWIWTFGIPVLFFWFFGALQGGGSGSSEEAKDPLTLVVPDGGDWLVDQLERRLAADYEVTRAAAFASDPDEPARAVRVPERFGERVLAGEDEVPLRLEGIDEGSRAELDRFRVSRAAYGVLADVVATVARGAAPTAEAFDELAKRPRSLSLRVRPAGERVTIPTGSVQSIPGTMVMFTMVMLLTSGAIGVLLERRLGRLRRLAAAPVSRAEVVLGHWVAIVVLGFVQIGYAVAVGTFVFDLEWGPDPVVVAAVLFLWSAFVASLAMLLSSFVRTEGQCVGIGVLSSNLLAALGGCWWPIEVTPRWMQELASWLPTGWVMNALHRLIVFQTGPSGAYAAMAWLTLGALALGAVAAKRFRYH